MRNYSSRGRRREKCFSRFLPIHPRPLSSFDTHARWQPVTQSASSRRSYGKIEDCEQSIKATIAEIKNQAQASAAACIGAGHPHVTLRLSRFSTQYRIFVSLVKSKGTKARLVYDLLCGTFRARLPAVTSNPCFSFPFSFKKF